MQEHHLADLAVGVKCQGAEINTGGDRTAAGVEAVPGDAVRPARPVVGDEVYDFAAGEIVGGIFYHNSLRAAGLMHGPVFGKIAGNTAATSI